MGDILELIKSRRTIKSYEPKFVNWDYLSKILEAGRHAPCCGNIQNWKFIVVIEPSQKKDLAVAAYEQYEIALAGALIVVCAEPEKAERYYGLRGERLYTTQNCAAAVQNMLLEAQSLGLGTTWIGAFDEEAVRDSCSIPKKIRPQAIIAVGFPKEIPEKPPKYPLETLVYFGSWSNKFRDPSKYLNDIATIMARKVNAAKESIQNVASSVVGKLKKESDSEE
ncbi:nitroreductase family protein [Candidatus Woesearchaeota archaeon]|jgi:nitroreductase|nr:nitroreductase family protein [Candidatus Woesearchaeota archaeon]MBT4151217.1 nitroreductase family protein [Candidatus Woesearchaeota archaeon]MBT4247661.1 nitroreductase family protein [Candidatus Woesearchaeota archaeon]MBT4434374.1 nitroreductase family protein [Candidatus Woesearchaeota archaeon]MBT7331737.1 nitroreductase family protein [Candidatus Woesearchaeota archaeon]